MLLCYLSFLQRGFEKELALFIPWQAPRTITTLLILLSCAFLFSRRNLRYWSQWLNSCYWSWTKTLLTLHGRDQVTKKSMSRTRIDGLSFFGRTGQKVAFVEVCGEKERDAWGMERYKRVCVQLNRYVRTCVCMCVRAHYYHCRKMIKAIVVARKTGK